MKKSTCTRLFRKGVDPQLIKEQTGHKSETVMLYEKSNLQQKKEVSDMLSVLPQEMDAIRASQSKMLERGEKLERKGSQVPQLLVVRGSPRSLRLMRVMIKRISRRLSQILRRGMLKRKIRKKSSQVLFWIRIKVKMSMFLLQLVI